MIYEWIERNRKDIDILTSFLVTAIPVVMLYSEALGITENTIPYCILMIILGIASHYASRMTQNKKLKEFWVTLKNNKLLWRIFLS